MLVNRGYTWTGCLPPSIKRFGFFTVKALKIKVILKEQMDSMSQFISTLCGISYAEKTQKFYSAFLFSIFPLEEKSTTTGPARVGGNIETICQHC